VWRPTPTSQIAVKKVLAIIVIVFCLSVQTYVIVRPSGERWWPFLSFPMYSRSFSSGATLRMRDLRARTCGEKPQIWKVEPPAIGYMGYPHGDRLRGIAEGRPTARDYRADLSRLVGVHVAPRPCALQVWEGVVTMTRDGFNASLHTPRWTPIVEWPVDDPDSVRVLTPR
jgi:hypothetical protein